MSQQTREWWRSQLSLSLVVQLLVMIGGWCVLFERLNATIADHDRRIVILETEIVPRKEHESREKIEEQKERLLDERLTNIERMLSEVLTSRVRN
jgi:hypothetical protein